MTEVEEIIAKELEANMSKRLARLVAVQVLYQASYKEEPLDVLITRARDEIMSMLNETEDDESEYTIREKPDMEILTGIVKGVVENEEPLNEMLTGALTNKSSASRMEKLFKAIFLAGVYELLHHKNIDAAIIINDYVDVAKAFFSGKESGLVNAVLDRLSKVIRAQKT